MSNEFMGGFPPPPPPPLPPPTKKTLQVPVIIGWGEKQKLVVKEITVGKGCGPRTDIGPAPEQGIGPEQPCLPAAIFRIVDVDKEVVITKTKLVPRIESDIPTCSPVKEYWSKIIINGYVDKNVIYKTITCHTKDDVMGGLNQITTRVYFSTFIEVKSKEPVKETDKAEIVSAIVEGEDEELLDPNPVDKCAPEWAVTYNKLLEKMLIRITAKVVRIEHVTVKPECGPQPCLE
ncbi:uncharacterized protein DUF3794 [Ruminiclostridium sufflavum DSM 19573]|uniref:Uncharacterized protein DUF3794 n=1 Tax=Ruminiclostridium sufflavum DSM 19573 TaxID=1121337 RepID=A0A318XGR7_9FIRM|nr:SPOCS domain-containing protein [Ruminiclostridium sufflavum]PYG85735.1 uncharacterized protein DUF3794 [Ruminiclostridium sufflavum DSM 19573]